MNVTLIPILTRLKQELTDRYDNRLLYLTIFGSQTLGDAESDIDVLVVLKPPVNPGVEIKNTGKAIALLPSWVNIHPLQDCI